jgi:hypothetical protein
MSLSAFSDVVGLKFHEDENDAKLVRMSLEKAFSGEGKTLVILPFEVKGANTLVALREHYEVAVCPTIGGTRYPDMTIVGEKK